MKRSTVAWVGGTAVAVALVVSAVILSWPAPAAQSPTQNVGLEISADSAGHYVYSASSIRASPGEILEISITNYDPMNHSAPWIYCNVTGTMDDMMEGLGGWMGPGMMGHHPVTGLTPAETSHTFTIRGNGFTLNVPIPAARNALDPAVVNFSVQMPGSGTFTWLCEANGMGSLEGSSGGMMGTLVIQ